MNLGILSAYIIAIFRCRIKLQNTIVFFPNTATPKVPTIAARALVTCVALAHTGVVLVVNVSVVGAVVGRIVEARIG